MHDQVGRHFVHFLGDEAIVLDVGWIDIAIVLEDDWFKREERFTGLVHGLNVVLVALRGDDVTEFSTAHSIYSHNNPAGLCRRTDVSDPGGVALASNAKDPLADTDIATARDIETGLNAHGRVEGAACVLIERSSSIGHVPNAADVGRERFPTVGRVEVAGGVGRERVKTIGRVAGVGVGRERLKTGGGVATADRVGKERLPADSGVAGAGGVGTEGSSTDSCVVVAGGVVKERSSTNPGQVVAGGVVKEDSKTNGHIGISGIVEECLGPNRHVKEAVDVVFQRPRTERRVVTAVSSFRERICTHSRIVDAGGEAKEGVCPLSGVIAGIASVRGRDNRLRSWQKCKAGEQQWDEKQTAFRSRGSH